MDNGRGKQLKGVKPIDPQRISKSIGFCGAGRGLQVPNHFYLCLNLYPATVLLSRQDAAELRRSCVMVDERRWPEDEPK